MYLVEGFPVGGEYLTNVWAATSRVLAPMLKLQKRKPALVSRFVMLIGRCAKVGFDNCPKAVRYERHGVYAFGDRHGSLLRAAGFYVEEKEKQTFLMMGFYEKHGQSMRGNEGDLIVEVKNIRDNGEWVYYEQDS